MYTYLIAVLIGAAAAGIGAWNVQAWRYDAKELARLEDQLEVERMRRQSAGQAASGHEGDKTAIRTVFVPITERVEHEIQTEKVVYSTVCIAPGGLQQLAEAARATGYAGEPGDTVPADPPAK